MLGFPDRHILYPTYRDICVCIADTGMFTMARLLPFTQTASNIPAMSLPTNERVFPPTGATRLQLAINYLIQARKELLVAFE